MIITAVGQQILRLEDTRILSLALLYFLCYMPKLTHILVHKSIWKALLRT